MSLSPEVEIIDTEESEVIETSKTFRFDFETKRITSEIISGKEAIEQFIYLTLRTRRFVLAIYSANIGEEVSDLVADNTVTPSFKRSEIPRLIEDAIIHDDRINRVFGFEIIEIEDETHVSFEVETVEGYLLIQEVF